MALLALCAPTALAYEQRVFDQAALFSTEQMIALEEQIDALRAAWDMDFVIVTTNDAGGKTALAYADDFYDYAPDGSVGYFGHGEGDDGCLFLIDMDNRELAISTYGALMPYLTDYRREALFDDIYGYAADGDYAQCASAFLSGMEGYLQAGVPDNQYYAEPEEKELTAAEGGIAALVAAAASLFNQGRIRRKYNLKERRYSYNLTNYARLNMLNNTDTHLRTSTSRQRIAEPGGGGFDSGRTSTHRSSSGRIHGGGSRRF